MCSDAQPWSNIWKHILALTEHKRWILNKHLKLHVPPPKTITSFSVTCCDLRKTLQASPSVSLLIINRKHTHDISQLIQKTERCNQGSAYVWGALLGLRVRATCGHQKARRGDRRHYRGRRGRSFDSDKQRFRIWNVHLPLRSTEFWGWLLLTP